MLPHSEQWHPYLSGSVHCGYWWPLPSWRLVCWTASCCQQGSCGQSERPAALSCRSLPPHLLRAPSPRHPVSLARWPDPATHTKQTLIILPPHALCEQHNTLEQTTAYLHTLAMYCTSSHTEAHWNQPLCDKQINVPLHRDQCYCYTQPWHILSHFPLQTLFSCHMIQNRPRVVALRTSLSLPSFFYWSLGRWKRKTLPGHSQPLHKKRTNDLCFFWMWQAHKRGFCKHLKDVK